MSWWEQISILSLPCLKSEPCLYDSLTHLDSAWPVLEAKVSGTVLAFSSESRSRFFQPNCTIFSVGNGANKNTSPASKWSFRVICQVVLLTVWYPSCRHPKSNKIWALQTESPSIESVAANDQVVVKFTPEIVRKKILTKTTLPRVLVWLFNQKPCSRQSFNLALYLHVLLRGVLAECSPPFLQPASHLVLRWLISHDLSGEGRSLMGEMDCTKLNCRTDKKLKTPSEWWNHWNHF